MKIQVVEYVPKTIQGEGPFAGQIVQLVRFSKCNLECIWCDTREKMNSPTVEIDTRDLIKRGLPIVVTGGEPTIAPEFEDLLAILCSSEHPTYVETNGLRFYSSWLRKFPDVTWIISPKLRSSNNDPYPEQRLQELLSVLGSPHIFLKFVISDPDRDFQDPMFRRFVGDIINGHLFLQPADNDIDIYRKMIVEGPEYGRYTLQLHKIGGLL